MTNFTTRSGLYRVWVPLRDEGKAPLISIWIDSTMAAFDQRERREEIGLPGVGDDAVTEEAEDSPPCVALAGQVFAPISRRRVFNDSLT